MDLTRVIFIVCKRVFSEVGERNKDQSLSYPDKLSVEGKSVCIAQEPFFFVDK